MKAFILAAGLGTRLKPWTLSHPKALVPVGDKPMLLRVIENLQNQGFDEISLNIHHFGDQIIEFLDRSNLKKIKVSDETDCLLDTGGALLHAGPLLCQDDSPVLVHNVDILSNADFRKLIEFHNSTGADITLLVSDRKSTRKLIFDSEMNLKGWHNLLTDEYRPAGIRPAPDDVELAFSGIYVISPELIAEMPSDGFSGKFSVIDYFLFQAGKRKLKGCRVPDLKLIDIGKPETLSQARLSYKDIIPDC